MLLSIVIIGVVTLTIVIIANNIRNPVHESDQKTIKRNNKKIKKNS